MHSTLPTASQALKVIALLATLASPLSAQPHDKKSQLSLDRIYNSTDFEGESLSIQWLTDSHGYTTLENGSSGQEIVRHDAITGARTILVSAHEVTPDLESSPIKIESYSFSKSLGKVLIYTNSKRVWRRRTRGDYWVLDRASGELRKLGGDLPASSLMFAKFSPTGNQVAYVHNRDIYVEDLREPRVTRLTVASSPFVINGTFDWVYEEELGLRDGFRWSPDGRSIAYWQIDTKGVRTFSLVDNTKGLYPTIHEFAYPKVGEQNAICQVGVADVSTQQTQWLNVDGDPRNHYIARMDWLDNQQIALQQLNRLQNTNRLLLAEAATGTVTECFIDQDPAWVEACDELVWIDNRETFTWTSERDGWRHVYLSDRKGNSRCATPGESDVIRLLHVDESGHWLYFIASPDDATCRYLFRQSFDGSALQRLTPPTETGWHNYSVSPDGRWAVHTWSSTETVPTIELVELSTHQTIRRLVKNKQLAKTWGEVNRNPVEFFKVELPSGHLCDGWCMRPPQMDKDQKYPLLVYVYGEPAGSTVTNRWSGGNFLWHQMMAQQGYVVVSIDNRGTKAPKGRTWRKSIYRQVGIIAPRDQAAAIGELLKQRSYLDPTRVGVWGWSGGGSMSLNAIFKYPDLYRTAVAIAPVPNQRFYDTIYQERYMGLPNDNPSGYRQGSPIHFAKALKGNLLLVHGTGDDNCHYQTTELLINELVKHNKKFSMMAYPNRTHSIREGSNTTLHLRTLMTDYLFEHLPQNGK
ncbi:MAG TPA: S9 family peptidase [Planctomycetaceae bacterium]|nr:S9 family peptidase [Planctomycetaceae bacterium]